MRAIVCVLISIGLLNIIQAEDDGRYRPEQYGDKAIAYNPIYNGRYDYRYRNNVGRNGFYYPNYYAYQPLYSAKPYEQLAAPFATYSKDISPVTARSSTAPPPVVPVTSTVQPPNYVYAKHYGNEGYARIIEQDNDINQNSYQYKYRTENGISAGESGVATGTGGTKVTGFYEYVGADGLTYRVDYTADENGFHPSGAHLPKL